MPRPRKQTKQDTSTVPMTVKAVEPRTNEPEAMPVRESIKEPEPKTGNSATMDKIMSSIEGLDQRCRDLDVQINDLFTQIDRAREELEKSKNRRAALSATLLMMEDVEKKAQHIFEIA